MGWRVGRRGLIQRINYKNFGGVRGTHKKRQRVTQFSLQESGRTGEMKNMTLLRAHKVVCATERLCDQRQAQSHEPTFPPTLLPTQNLLLFPHLLMPPECLTSVGRADPGWGGSPSQGGRLPVPEMAENSKVVRGQAPTNNPFIHLVFNIHICFQWKQWTSFSPGSFQNQWYRTKMNSIICARYTEERQCRWVNLNRGIGLVSANYSHQLLCSPSSSP